jgi:hypothetical protein
MTLASLSFNSITIKIRHYIKVLPAFGAIVLREIAFARRDGKRLLGDALWN